MGGGEGLIGRGCFFFLCNFTLRGGGLMSEGLVFNEGGNGIHD